MEFETIGDWCKWLEKNFSPEQMIPTLPVIIRLDGVNFHSWTKGLAKPFDINFVNTMKITTKLLVEETNTIIGYTQSDEITLILYSDNKKKGVYHEGKKQKILSKLTAHCTNFFNTTKDLYIPISTNLAAFDCRIYQTPTLDDACIQLLWRENDATKNSIAMLAQSKFSHKELQNLKGFEMQDKLMQEKGINWNNLRPELKRGTYIKRVKTTKQFTPEEIKHLPPQHDYFKNPNIVIERNIIDVIEYPPLTTIENKVGVIFNNEKVIQKTT